MCKSDMLQHDQLQIGYVSKCDALCGLMLFVVCLDQPETIYFPFCDLMRYLCVNCPSQLLNATFTSFSIRVMVCK